MRVRAVSINRLDVYTRLGIRGTKLPADRFPHILGGDCAGDVAETGQGVADRRPGERVVVDPMTSCGVCPSCVAGEQFKCPETRMLGTHRPGSYAEYVVAPAANVFPIPGHLGYEEAAALPTVFLPSWGMVLREGRLQKEETALVLSASSGVGTAAIQVVKGVVGATCIATTSTGEKSKAARELGADHVINYALEDVAQRVKEITQGRGVDLVVDCVGAKAFEAAYASLARGGRYGVCGVTTGHQATLHLGFLFSKQLRVFGMYMGSFEEMRQIVEAASKGTIRSVIAGSYPLEEARQAHEAMERSEHFGKLVLTVG